MSGRARLAAIVTAVLLLPQAAWACPSCFGASDGPLARANTVGMLVLLGVTVSVLGGVAAFVFYLWRRAREVRAGGPVPAQEGRA